jgi:eukaryotic-like serine/threonine-protein kinase
MKDDAATALVQESTAAAVQRLIGAEIDGRYRIVEQIGAGGMGSIYRVEHLRLERQFAMKVPKAELCGDARTLERFEREARRAASISSEHVVRIVDSGLLPDGRPYFVMDLLVGSDLRRLIDKHQTLVPARVANLGIDACRGLAAAHAVRLIHRDLKPENLFVTRGDDGCEVCKILDFGVAKGMDANATRPGALIGTARYMAPEQVGLEAPIGPATDICALGIILYECLSGVTPFRGDTTERTLYQIMNGTPKPLLELCPDVPPGLAAVIERALARDPEARHPSAFAFAEALLPFAPGRRARLDDAWCVDVTAAPAPVGGTSFVTSASDSSRSADAPHLGRRETPKKRPGPLLSMLGGAAAVAVLWLLSTLLPGWRASKVSLAPAPSARLESPAIPAPSEPAQPVPAHAAALALESAAVPEGSSPATSSAPVRDSDRVRVPRRLPPNPSFDRANPYAP